MCIIAYVKPYKKIDDETIINMFDNNPDGAGLMYKLNKNSRVKIIKGFDDVKELIKEFRSIPESAERAIHCRIATAGKISIGCCHPFPVRNDTGKMTQAKDESPIAFMHNGIIDWCNPVGNQRLKAEESDTMIFGRDILYKLKGELDNQRILDMIEESINASKLLIFRNNGDTIVLGKWIKDKNGILYSNDTYKYSYYNYSSSNWRGLSAFTKCNTQTLSSYNDYYDIPIDDPYSYESCNGDCYKCLSTVCEYSENYIPPKQYNTLLAFIIKKEKFEESYKNILDDIKKKGYELVRSDIYTADKVIELDIIIKGSAVYLKSKESFAGFEPVEKELV